MPLRTEAVFFMHRPVAKPIESKDFSVLKILCPRLSGRSITLSCCTMFRRKSKKKNKTQIPRHSRTDRFAITDRGTNFEDGKSPKTNCTVGICVKFLEIRVVVQIQSMEMLLLWPWPKPGLIPCDAAHEHVAQAFIGDRLIEFLELDVF